MIPFYCVILLFSYLPSDGDTPPYLLGDFKDDYDIKYTISDSTWIMYPDFQLDILTIDSIEMFVLGYDQSDSTYTRIDFMKFQNQGDYTWGFCYTSYGKKDPSDALSGNSANRDTPKTGCNGFPFSRMKPVDGF